MSASNGRYGQLVRMVSVARGLEAEGFYNAAKVLWAATYSEEVRASEAQGVPGLHNGLDGELAEIIAALEADGAKPEVVAALRSGQAALREERAILFTEIPDVYVCRFCGDMMLGHAPHRCPACGARGLTLRQFPAVFYLEPLTPEQALDGLAATPDRMALVLEGLSEAQVSQPLEPGEWTLREALLHLFWAQALLAGRVEKMLAEDDPSLEGVSGGAMVAEKEMSSAEILAQFRASREGTVATLEGLPLADWWRSGQHSEFGPVTILQQASYFAKHDQAHMPQIDRLLAALVGG